MPLTLPALNIFQRLRFTHITRLATRFLLLVALALSAACGEPTALEQERIRSNQYLKKMRDEFSPNLVLRKGEKNLARKCRHLPKAEQEALLHLLEFTSPIAARVDFFPNEGKHHVTALTGSGNSIRSESNTLILVDSEEAKSLAKFSFLRSMKLYSKHMYACDGGPLFYEETDFSDEAMDVLKTMKELRDFNPPDNASDIDIGKLEQLNDIEVLTLGSGNSYYRRGAFIDKLSPKSKLRILYARSEPIEVRRLKKLYELEHFMYAVVASNTAPFRGRRLYKSGIPDYIKECELRGYSTTTLWERGGGEWHQSRMEALAKCEAIEAAKEARKEHHRVLGFRAANIFTSGMVLQREMPVPIWGTSRPGEEIAVSFAGQKKIAKANEKGDWFLKLDPLAASAEGRVLTIENGKKKEELKDVLVGEVWLATGEPSMSVLSRPPRRNKTSIPFVNSPNIRFFCPVYRESTHPKQKTEAYDEQWKSCVPQNIPKGPSLNFSGVSALFAEELQAKLNVPIGIIAVTDDYGRSLKDWTSPESFLRFPLLESFARPRPKQWWSDLRPSVSYNGTLFPIIPYAIRGVIRGSVLNADVLSESERRLKNITDWQADRAGADFTPELSALYFGWKDAWRQKSFPFYYTQITPRPAAPHFLDIWEQQAAFLAQPHTGMVVINDGIRLRSRFYSDSHKALASRFARLALSRNYGFKFPDDCGPLFHKAVVSADGKRIVVEFIHANSGLATRDGKPLSHFEVAGEDGKFLPAVAKIIAKNKVEVACGEISGKLAGVRFAWDVGAAPNLINNEKLPAGAFRWPRPEKK
jgi:sialate O-acetylesterase